jgi:hypothetical protein
MFFTFIANRFKGYPCEVFFLRLIFNTYCFIKFNLGIEYICSFKLEVQERVS